MKNLSKILSIILSISFLSVSTLSLSALAEVDCSERNPQGGYFDQQFRV